jgi:propanediol dehydratase small subunit
VINEFGIAAIHKTTCQHASDAQARIDLPQQERAPIAAELATGKISDDFALPKVLEKELPGETLCLTRCGARLSGMWLHAKQKHRILALVASSV